jgi:hypothetical protein
MNIFIEASGLQNPMPSITSVSSLIKGVLGIAMYVGIPFIGLLLVYAGFKFLFARGNAEKIKESRYNLLWIIIGIGVFLGAWAFAVMIDSTISSIMSG